ncbi:hypothetical protein [Candidatus Stoquefichus massiliensis]|uniref:hypothetical protein n=1 Tax=Candidatus Stoquefichus massiliensis TaxID=1470350 RepID=UPI0004868901|nr:hypothetical protein [Candidatus Stoquefichus massiliensis]
MDNKTIKISLFSRLIVTYEEHEVVLSDYLGKQLLILFEMLIYYRHHVSSNDLIIDVIWKKHKNPKSALKYSVHRLRAKLKEIPEFEKLDFIITVSNGYVLNPEYSYQIDCEEFTTIHQMLKHQVMNQESVSYAIRLVQLYQGQIYQTSRIQWALYINNFYKRIYLYYIELLCNYFFEHGEYHAVVQITNRVSIFVPEYEKAYYYHFHALIEQANFLEAKEYYETTIKNFSENYPMCMSQEFRELHHQLMLHNKITNTINEIYNELLVDKQQRSAFFCEFDVFKYIFEKALRDQIRYHLPYYLIMLTLETFPENMQFKIMQKLKKCIYKTIRSSDSFTRVNELQFLILINCDNEADVHTIAQRIITKFYRSYTNGNAKIGYSIKKVKGRESLR